MTKERVKLSHRRKTIFTRIISIIILGIFINGCEYNNRDDMFPELSYDCTQLSEYFAENIQPIIEENCLGCHENPSPAGNISFESYDGVAQSIKYGTLLDRIQRGPNETGFMPKNGSPLSEESIEKIQSFYTMSCP